MVTICKMYSRSRMLSISNGQVVFVLLALLQTLVFASLEDVEDKTEAMAKKLIDFGRLPWIEGQDFLLHSSDSSRVQEARTLIKGIESGQTWALQVLGILSEMQREIRKKNIEDIGAYNIQDDSCPLVSFDDNSGTSNGSGDLPSSSCHSSPNVGSQIIQTMTGAIKSEPVTGGFYNSLFPPIQYGDLTTLEISTVVLFSVVCAFIITCTISDIAIRMNDRRNLSTTLNDKLSKFSLYTNALALLSTRTTPDMMPAIHGIRFLSFIPVIIGHRYLLLTFIVARKTTALDALEWKNSWLIVYLQMVPYAVDNFFLVSGFLASHLYFKAIKLGKKINWPMVYLYRYFRITPCLAALMLFSEILSRRFGSGLLWETVLSNSVAQCRESWWANLLHVQNLVKNGFLCLLHCWYLAADMQLFWITPVILYPLHRWPKFGFRLLGLFLAVSIITPATSLAINGYSNANMRVDMDVSRWVESFEYYYIPTYNRACPYLAGILLGYDVAKKRRCLTQAQVAINWLVAGSLILSCTWFTNRIYNTNFAYDLIMETAFAALSRPAWSIAIAWIFYACTQGYGGFATRFLSLRIFFPLSRLAYGIYLAHMGIQVITITPLESSADYFGIQMFYGLCVDLVASIAVAFPLCLFVESPVIALAKILMNHDNQLEKTTPVQDVKKSEEAKIVSE